MRNPERIDGIIELIRVYWKEHPDLRLGQIICNMCPHDRPFYYEDSDLEKKLIEELNKS